MKKIFGLVALIGFSFFQFSFGQTAMPHYGYEDLQPLPSQQKVQRDVVLSLMNYHYRKFALTDSLSSKVFDNLIENVDGGKAYFTKGEIEGFEKYRHEIDEALLVGDLKIPFEIYNKFRAKYKQRYDFIQKYLEKPLNFSKKETYEPDRSKAMFPMNETELDNVWENIILSQAIALKLVGYSDSTSGSTDSSVVATLKKRYKTYENRISKFRSDDVFQSYMNAFTEILDPHTRYMIPSNAAQFNIDMSQSLEGIGATLRNEEDYVMIIDIVPGGPLFKTGVNVRNHYILAVAQGDTGEYQDVVGWLTDDAVKVIRGKKDSVVRLKVISSDAPIGSQPIELRMVREKIKLEEATAKGKIIELKHQDQQKYKIGLIDIPMFYRDFEYARMLGTDFQSTTKDVKKILDNFKNEKVEGVLIDLRNNGGGSLVEAIQLTGLFIGKGPVVQRRNSFDQVEVEKSNENAALYTGSLLILQNRFSASASEIFAGAIQDYKRGIIVGEKSYGKGTVQNLVDFDRVRPQSKGLAELGGENNEKFGQLKLTTEKFYRVTGNSTQRIGVEPDITLPTPFENNEMGESSQASALPFDKINSADFQKNDLVNDFVIDRLENNFQNRLKTNEDLLTLVEDVEEYKEQKAKKSFSLNLQERQKMLTAQDQKTQDLNRLGKARKSTKVKVLADEDDDELEREEDVYLLEAQRILADLIEIEE